MHPDSTRLSVFAYGERTRLPEDGVHRFVPAMGKVEKYAYFLEIVVARHQALVMQHAELAKKATAFMQPGGGRRTMSTEEVEIHWQMSSLAQLIHLEVETYYLFAKILLDKVAHFIEHAFGTVRRMPLDSHDKLTKHLKAYVSAKVLKCPNGFFDELVSLKRRISDFRDHQIAHEKSPYMTHGTVWGPSQQPRIALVAFPSPGARSMGTDAVYSEELANLHTAIHVHIGHLIEFYELNREKSAYMNSADNPVDKTS